MCATSEFRGAADRSKPPGSLIVDLENMTQGCVDYLVSALLISQDEQVVAAGPQARVGNYLCVLLIGRSGFLRRLVEDNTDEGLLVESFHTSDIMRLRGGVCRKLRKGKTQLRKFFFV